MVMKVLIFPICYLVVILELVSSVEPHRCSPECRYGTVENATECFNITVGCDFSFPHLAGVLPLCWGYPNEVQSELFYNGIHASSTGQFYNVKKRIDFNVEYEVDNPFFVRIDFSENNYGKGRHLSSNITVVNVGVSDAREYNVTLVDPNCYSYLHDNLERRPFLQHTYRLFVSHPYPKCSIEYLPLSRLLAPEYRLICSVEKVIPPIELDIIAKEPCILRTYRSSSPKLNFISAYVFGDCDFTDIECITTHAIAEGFSGRRDSELSCTWNLKKVFNVSDMGNTLCLMFSNCMTGCGKLSYKKIFCARV